MGDKKPKKLSSLNHFNMLSVDDVDNDNPEDNVFTPLVNNKAVDHEPQSQNQQSNISALVPLIFIKNIIDVSSFQRTLLHLTGNNGLSFKVIISCVLRRSP